MALRLDGMSPSRDESFTAALLHDIGVVVVAKIAPSWAHNHVGLEEQIAQEKAEFGATHAEIGAHLLDLWGLPQVLVEAVGAHHTPEAIPSRDARIAAVTYASDAWVLGADPDARLVAAYGFAHHLSR